jgi:hypothetical protein
MRGKDHHPSRKWSLGLGYFVTAWHVIDWYEEDVSDFVYLTTVRHVSVADT